MTHLVDSNGFLYTGNQVKDYLNDQELVLDRGYTSHEHLHGVELIHMNGRLYDPLLRRFLNADENIQDPNNTQNYNKYGYVMNNPLMYNDPSGEFFVAGFFLTWVAPMIWGAIIGAGIAGTAYLLKAVFTGDFTWSGFGKTLFMGVLGGAVSGFLNPGLFSPSYSFWNHFGSGVVSQLMPSWDFELLGIDFNISPSIAIGKGWGFGANISATFRAGDFALSAGFGIMNYGAHAGSGTSGWERRYSLLAGTLGTEGNLGIMLGTNVWKGMHDQQTGIIKLQRGDFSMSYENDGAPFGGTLGDNNDSFRTAAMTIRIGDYYAGFNLFTGERHKDSYEENGINSWDAQRMKEGACYSNGACLSRVC